MCDGKYKKPFLSNSPHQLTLCNFAIIIIKKFGEKLFQHADVMELKQLFPHAGVVELKQLFPHADFGELKQLFPQAAVVELKQLFSNADVVELNLYTWICERKCNVIQCIVNIAFFGKTEFF